MPPGEQTTQTSSEPWKKAIPALSLGMNDAMRMYKQGYGANTGSMVVPWSKRTMQGMEGTMDVANQNIDGGMNPQLQQIINNGGFNNQQKGALDNWQATANGSYDFNANPGSQGVLDSILRDTRNNVNANAAGAGRYLGAMHQGRMAQDTADVSSNFRMSDYNNWLGRRDAANTNVFNGAQTGLGNMSAAYQGQMAPFQSMMGVGTMDEDLNRRVKDDQARVGNLGWDQLQKLMAAASGAGRYGTTTATAPGPNPLLQMAGTAATGANLFSSFF